MNKMKRLILATTYFVGIAGLASAQTSSGPLSGISKTLNNVGFYPNATFVQLGIASPDQGQETGASEFVSILDMGADLDLGKMIGLKGTSVHFQEMVIPKITNLNYGNQVGDVIGGNPGPYIPWAAHLQRFTLEQKFLNDKAFIEGGRSNAGDYFALATCDQQFACISSTTMIQKNAGFAPPPYANWSARAGYNFTPALRVQGGFWKYDPAFPFSNGWESYHYGVPSGNVYLADISYRTDPHKALYPSAYEAMFYRNTLSQSDPLTGQVTNGNSGIFLSAKQTFWRKNQNPLSTSLSAFVADVTEFNGKTGDGLRDNLDAGLTVQGMFPSRPFDSYGLKFTWVRLTSDEQAYLQKAQLSSTGSPYTVGPNEYGFGTDATFVLTPSLIFQPYATYILNSNAWASPTSTHRPHDGFNVGFTFVALIGQMAGLGHYNYP
ncbi:hypothetical protein AA11237_1683 [Acidocella aminolytica 101 = DSM 11237]|nr:hypothetical protein AA11237_1683 [Acidocella aminolytica 101 = DSM 11237]